MRSVNNPERSLERSDQKTNEASKIKFLTTYNPQLPKIDSIIKKYIPILHSDDNMKDLFPPTSICTIYKRNKNLKEIIAPSKYPRVAITKTSSITSCSNCDICKNYMVFDNTFVCSATGKKYYVKGDLHCESRNIIYLISCTNCWEQYVGSAVNFKVRFRIHKSDIKTKKERC